MTEKNMNNKNIFLLIGLLLLLFSCSTPKEATMPFRNLVYSSESIFPIQSSNQEWIFRAWINNGTSIDRVISVSKDSLMGNESYLIESGSLYKKNLFGRKVVRVNNVIKVNPNSGYDKFIQVIDSLDLENYKSQDNFDVIANHKPFSLYVIEIKKGDKYHLFSFNTYFPMSLIDSELEVDEKYEFIENLLLDEFRYRFYVK
jgi:hypothetical protein